jgi:hypothetical protein
MNCFKNEGLEEVSRCLRPTSVEELRAKAGKTMMAKCGCRVWQIFTEVEELRGEARSENIAAQVLPDCRVKAQVRQRSISDDLIFCYLLYQDKSSSIRGNERLRAISNLPCIIAYIVGDCFVPRNDVMEGTLKRT